MSTQGMRKAKRLIGRVVIIKKDARGAGDLAVNAALAADAVNAALAAAPRGRDRGGALNVHACKDVIKVQYCNELLCRYDIF